jgi:hypothetical protein
MRKLLFSASSHGYEEGYTVKIYEDSGRLQLHIYGHACLIGDYETVREISQDAAMELMLEEAENEDGEYLYES